MNGRITLSGLSAGLVSAFLARMWLALQIGDLKVSGGALPLTASQRAWLETGIWIVVGLVVFTAGWSAARWSWAGSKTASFAAGAVAGLLAGAVLLLYPLQLRELLEPPRVLLKTAAQSFSDAELTILAYVSNVRILAAIVQETTNTLLWLPFLGGLGGWVSFFLEKEGWGSEPEPPSWIHRFPVYALTLNGAVLLMVVTFLTPLLNETFSELLPGVSASSSLPPEITRLAQESGFALVFGGNLMYLTGLLVWQLPLMVTLGWLLRRITRYKVHHWVGWLLWFALWGGFGLLVALPAVQILQSPNPLVTFVPAFPGGFLLVMLLGFAAFALLAGLLGAPEVSTAPQAAPSFSAWFSAGLGFAVLAATQWMTAAGTFITALYLQASSLDRYALIEIPGYLRAAERTSLLIAGIALVVSWIGFFVLGGVTALVRASGRVFSGENW